MAIISLKPRSIRQKKVSSDIQRAVSMKLITMGLHEITVVFVDLTKDLKICDIYVVPMRDGYDCVKDLNANQNEIRYHLSKELHLKTVPKLRFYLDETSKNGNIVYDLLADKSNDEQV